MDDEVDGLKSLEDGLKTELTELKQLIEEGDLLHNFPTSGMSSVYIPKDVEHFRRERRACIQRSLEVTESMPLIIQADVMSQEMKLAELPNFTEKSLPLLVHQYFTDRMHELAALKMNHLLRWKRFCPNTSVVEACYPFYKDRLDRLMKEYLDCSSRAHRLATSREGFYNETEQGIDELTNEDILIYFRWLLSQLYSLKILLQFLGIIQWIPFGHRDHLATLLDSKEKRKSDTFNYPTEMTDNNPSTVSERSISKALPMNGQTVMAKVSVGTATMAQNLFNMALAAAGGGLCMDIKTQKLPLHTNELNSLRPFLLILCHVYNMDQEVNVCKIKTPADEMELFSVVNRKFRYIFLNQEQMRTFKSYDSNDKMSHKSSLNNKPDHQGNSNANTSQATAVVAASKWGTGNSMQALLKPCNWLTFIKLKPKLSPDAVKYISELRAINKTDEILQACSHFLRLSDPERVQDALRHHALLVQHPPIVHTASVLTHKAGRSTDEVFKKIYTNPELYKSGSSNLKGEAKSTTMTAGDDYDFNQAMQMLGLEEADKTQEDPSSVQGAYLSFLHLRILKIRDVQRTCISVLNYFRSIERTLTIADQGLTLDNRITAKKPQNHRSGTEFAGHQGGGGNLGSHGYLFDTPKDFVMSETEFMDFAEVENHEDFYYHEQGRIHVMDQAGLYIVYKCALDDFDELERDLLLIASSYIEIDKEIRGSSLFKKGNIQNPEVKPGEVDINLYAHGDVDRYGILYDLWTNETAFLECKKDLMDLYMEAYHHVSHREERRRVAQCMVNIIHRRPRFDSKDNYFVNTYRLECAILRLETILVKQLLNRQIEHQRAFLHRCKGDIKDDFGVPLPICDDIRIAPAHDECVLTPMNFLEYHPSLCVAAYIPDALERCLDESQNQLNLSSLYHKLSLHQGILEVALKELNSMHALGSSYGSQAIKNLFGGHVIEDPSIMTSIAIQYMQSIEAKHTRGDKRSRKLKVVHDIGRLLELIVTRWRLMESAWHSEILSKIYRTMAQTMLYNEFHLFMRYLQMESAKKKQPANMASHPLFITSLQDDDSSLDKFCPSLLPLAIHELDESHVGLICLKDRDSIYQFLNGNGVENLQVVLKTQITHKNALASAIYLGFYCNPKFRKDFFSQKNQDANGGGTLSPEMGKLTLVSKEYKFDPEAFFSLQLEKSPARDRMLNQFVQKTTNSKGLQETALLRNVTELERLKRTLISSFNDDFIQRVAQCSLRAQIIAYYNTILKLLKQTPSLINHYFVLGERKEKKSELDNHSQTDVKTLRDRPRQVLTNDGNSFLNLWFLPHYTEILHLYKDLSDEDCIKALKRMLRIVAGLHDILHYLVAQARLATSKSIIIPSADKFDLSDLDDNPNGAGKSSIKSRRRSSSMKLASGAAAADASIASNNHNPTKYDGGPLSSLCSELRELQAQIDCLIDPHDPDAVADLLDAKRQVLYLTFDVCIRHVLRETFLSNNNMVAFQSVSNNMHYALRDLSNAQQSSGLAVSLNVPEPMEARDPRAQALTPWFAFINSQGLFPISFAPWYNIERNISMCLLGLNHVDRPVVHGELLALNLCLEEVLQQGDLPEFNCGRPLDVKNPDEIALLGRRYQDKLRKMSSEVSIEENKDTPAEALKWNEFPLKCYQVLRYFLIIWKRLEVMKMEWAKRKFGLDTFSCLKEYKLFCQSYKSERLYPLLKSLASQYNQIDLYDFGPGSATDIHIAPKGIPEIVLKQRQLGKLIETIEMAMIREVRKRILRQTDLVIKEKNREEGNLPLELWKKPAMKETLSIKRPNIVEDFIQEVLSNVEEDPEAKTITFTVDHFNACLLNMATSVMASQREIYENYAMYYENMLKQEHRTLYNREREIEKMHLALAKKELSTQVEVQFQLADKSHSLLLEVTALRAKVAELEAEISATEDRVKQAVASEYEKALTDIFCTAFEQKTMIDEYRNHLHDVTLKRIQEVRTEAAIEMSKLKDKSGAKLADEDALSDRNLQLNKNVNELRQRNIHLQQMMSRMKALFMWKHSWLRADFLSMYKKMEKQKDQVKTRLNSIEIDSEQKEILLHEELDRLKEYLLNTETELKEHKKILDHELKEKSEKAHAEERKAATDRQLALVKQMHIEELLNELNDKKGELTEIRNTLESKTKTQRKVVETTSRQVEILKKELIQEKRLKGTAMNKAESLLSQVYNYEAALNLQRVSSAAGATSGFPSRITSAADNRTGTSSRYGSSVWPPVGRTATKALTPELKISNHDRKIRPKTLSDIIDQYRGMPYTPDHFSQFVREDEVANYSLRSRLAEQLLYNIPPDPYETLLNAESTDKKA